MKKAPDDIRVIPVNIINSHGIRYSLDKTSHITVNSMLLNPKTSFNL